jgi:hypothetical protein
MHGYSTRDTDGAELMVFDLRTASCTYAWPTQGRAGGLTIVLRRPWRYLEACLDMFLILAELELQSLCNYLTRTNGHVELDGQRVL